LDAMRRVCGLDGSKGVKKTPKGDARNWNDDDGGGGGAAISGGGGGPVRFGMVLPLCTGMSMSLVLASLRESILEKDSKLSARGTNTRDVVLWSRIDQKSCYKAVLSAGLTCVVVPTRLDNANTTPTTNTDQVITDLDAMTQLMTTYSHRILAVISTTSCFAPRVSDKVDEIGKLCAERDIAHVVNNAYGLQCERTCKLINRACVVGRVDAMICSTDKNFLVPVGGAIVTSPHEQIIQSVGKLYAGRASSAPILDLFITLLSMGLNGYKRILERRKKLVIRFEERLAEVAAKYGERPLSCPLNTISFGITLDTLAAGVGETEVGGNSSSSSSNNKEAEDAEIIQNKKAEITSLFGSMLFTRCVSGTRVVSKHQRKIICGQEFIGFGSSTDQFPNAYLTAACAVGLSGGELEDFFVRLDKCFKDFFAKRKKEEKRREKQKKERG